MARARFHKWNGFITMDIGEVIELLSARGLEMDSDRTAITGVVYNPELQEFTIFLTSMFTAKQEKEFTKVLGGKT